MKILFLSDVFFPRVNGVSTSIKIFIEDLQKLDHEVHLICPAYNEKSTKSKNITTIKSKPISLQYKTIDFYVRYSYNLKM